MSCLLVKKVSASVDTLVPISDPNKGRTTRLLLLLGRAITRGFQARLAELGIPRCRFHELRHGFATLLLAQGVNLRVIMEMMGHTSMRTTALTYTHVVPELQKDAVTKLGQALS